MINIRHLRQQLGDTVKSIETVQAAAKAAGRDRLTEDENKNVDGLLAAAESLKADIERAERVNSLEAESARQIEPEQAARVEVKDNRKPGSRLANMILSIAATKGSRGDAIIFAEQTLGDADVAKALAAGTGSAGGYSVPAPIASEVIPALMAAAVVRRMGARTITMPNGKIDLPRINTASSATYIGENANIGKTEPVYGRVQLSFKKLAALVPISNDLIRYATPNTNQLVIDDLIAAMAAAEDSAFIRGAAAGNNPAGIATQMAAGQKAAMTATPDLAKITNDLNNAIKRVVAANVLLRTPGWLVSPRTLFYLKALRDSTGSRAFPELDDMRLLGYPVGMSTQIPENLGTGTDETEVYFVEFSDCIIGESQNLVVDTSDQAAYHDGSNVVAAFSLDQTVIRVIAEHDFALRYDKSASMITGVQWGV